MRSYLLPVSVVSSALFVAWGALADTPQGGAAPGATSTTPAPADTTKTATAVPLGKGKALYSAKVMKGHAAYIARDFQGAIAAYKDAIKDDANDAFAHYFLGEAQLAAGNIAEADASYASGLRVVAAKDDLHAKFLFVIADLRERQGKWPDAKKAWDEYAQFLSTHPNVKGYAATATERNKVIDTHVDLEAKYAAVKQRIEQRLKETTAPPPDDGPQGPTKKK
jgi:tetratricopeptide (TPR) repeat protein